MLELISLTFEEPLKFNEREFKILPLFQSYDVVQVNLLFVWFIFLGSFLNRATLTILTEIILPTGWTKVRKWDVEGNATKFKFALILDRNLPRLIDFTLLFYSYNRKKARSKKISLGNSVYDHLREESDGSPVKSNLAADTQARNLPRLLLRVLESSTRSSSRANSSVLSNYRWSIEFERMSISREQDTDFSDCFLQTKGKKRRKYIYFLL